jgi:transcriptional regulator NrdR family protein
MQAETFWSKIVTAVSKQNDPILTLETYVLSRIELMQKISTRYSFLKQEFFELMPIVEENRKVSDLKEVAFVTELLSAVEQNGRHEVANPEFASKMLVNTLKGLEIQMYLTDQTAVEGLDKTQFTHFVLYGILSQKETPNS